MRTAIRSTLVLLAGCAGLGLAMPSNARAQALEHLEAASPEQTGRGQAEYWARTLGLTRSQTDALEGISLRFAQDAEPVVRSAASDSEKLRTIADLERSKEVEILAILTSEQRERYLAVKQQMAEWSEKYVR